MSLSLRAKLRLPAGCSDEALQEACSRYHAIYKGVLDSTADESVKAIARARLEDLVSGARAEGISIAEADLYSWSSATANIPASVEAELSRLSAGSQITESKAKQLTKMIDALPESAKRHYLRALVTLASREASTDTYQEAVNQLKPALSGDPENPVYPAMLDGIEEEIRQYREEHRAWKEKREAEIEAEKRRALIKRIFSGLGTVLLYILGAGLAIASGLFTCMCSMCDSC